MSSRNFNIVLTLAFISLVGVIGMQVYWVQNTVKLNTEQFERSIDMAQKSVINRLLDYHTERNLRLIERNEPCFDDKTDIRDLIPSRLLDSLVKVEFQCLKIGINFDYALYNKVNNRLVAANVSDLHQGLLESRHQQSVSAIYKPGKYYLSVYVPKPSSHILSKMIGWMVLSALFLLAVIFTFGLTIKTVLRHKKLSKMKSDFINNMTHEFKTPIATISIAGEMLMKQEIQSAADKVSKYASVILSENRRLQSQVEQILQSAIIENEAIQLRLKVSDIHRILHKAIQSFELRIQELSGSLTVDFQDNIPSLMLDRTHFLSVFGNLIDNAIKYSPEVVDIRVTTSADSNGVIVKIMDKGIGIAKQNQKLVFRNLYRVSTGDIHDVKGFGIGLYYVKRIVELHGGSVKLTSTVGKGSTFEVFLPFDNIHSTAYEPVR